MISISIGLSLLKISTKYVVSQPSKKTKTETSAAQKDVRVTGRANEVQACMDAQVDLVLPLGLLFLPHIRLVLVVDKINDGSQ